jgi:hypothetical protein
MDGAQHIEPGAANQLKIEHDAVGLGAQDAPHGVLGALRFSYDARAFDVLDELDEGTADVGRVLGDKDCCSYPFFHGRQSARERRAGPSGGL